MKIENRDISSGLKNRKISKTKVSTISETENSFKSQLAEFDQKEVKKRFDNLLTIVDRQGEKLKKSLDKKDLIEYKKRVKDFLRLIQKEFAQTKQSFNWDGTGNLKTYTIIEKVDQSLDLLHKMFLQKQADVLEVVKKIDEIRGLLIDLYI